MAKNRTPDKAGLVPRRNPVVRNATILRKGGVHRSSVSATRGRVRQQINDEITEAMLEAEDAQAQPEQSSSHKTASKRAARGRPSSFWLHILSASAAASRLPVG